MWLNLAAVIVAATLHYAAVRAQYADDDLIVEARGGRLYGGVDPATPDVRHFLGIPYAQPPLNDLRFAPPKPPPARFGEFTATRMPPNCMQYVSGKPSIVTRDVPEFKPAGPFSEDCLTLSIWAPRGTRTTYPLLPVFVWFYGGVFQGGGTNTPYQIPAQWVQQREAGEAIIVSFNHRGNIFGFPNAAGLPANVQNVGLLDQRLALEWVYNNIHAFGGNNHTIGLFGHGSGAVSIAYYTYAYREEPIASSVVLSSGNEFVDMLSQDPGHANFTFVASHVGCGGLAPADELTCMRRADAHVIEDVIQRYSDNGTAVYFSPVVDERTVFANYTERAQGGKLARLPTLIGNSRDEGSFFAPYNPAGIDVKTAEEVTSSSFFCTSLKSARLRLRAGIGGVFGYVYSGNFSNVSPRPWMGAYHGSELPALFGTHGLYRGPSPRLEQSTAGGLQYAWSTFMGSSGNRPAVMGWNVWDGSEWTHRDIRRATGNIVEFGLNEGIGLDIGVYGIKEMVSKCGKTSV